ncbi:hypothetical protein QBC39DRAFT_325796 [Podospora conica]|nr:hypothetical protein QBC39DRAFT_325796 [Schizothecium conicum]
MKSATVTAVLASAAGANAQWFGQAPECVQSCLKSQWSTATSGWPAPTEYCGAGQAAPAATCISSACAATPTAITSYSSLSSSLCDKIASCSKAGSTGVMTLTAPAFTGTGFPGFGGGRGGPGGPGGRPGGGPGGPFGGAGGHGPWGADGITRTWTGGVYTVTGCPFAGSPWAGGPDGWNGGLGGSPWGNWGAGWKWSTATKTITQVLTITEAGSTRVTTSIGLATVAQAVNGEITQVSVIAQPQETNGAASNKAVQAAGVVLGGVVAVVGLL